MSIHVCRTSLVLAMALIATAARADTATLTITGRVLPGTCTISAPVVTLPAINANDLVVRNNALQATAVTLSSCIGVSKATLSFDGVAEDFDRELWKNTSVAADAARGVSISILNGPTGTVYLMKGSVVDLPVAGATASLPIRVGYYLTAGHRITPGEMTADVTITATYQ